MNDAKADALPEADPKHVGHALWAALQLARILREEDAFDRLQIAVAFLTAARAVAAESGEVLGFAMHMEREACRDAAMIGATIAAASEATRN